MSDASIDRATIREWVASHRSILESAQADGTLARTKLDVKDRARISFDQKPMNGFSAFDSVLTEELDAFCSDMRLATVTVQSQIERRIHHNGRGAFLGILAFFVTLFLAALNIANPLVGFGLPVLVGFAVFLMTR